MRGRKELYVFLECPECKDIFRMFKSSYRAKVLCVLNNTGQGTTECPSCLCFKGICSYNRVSRRVWIKSNEVRPDKI